MLSRFGLLLNIMVKIRRKEKVILQNEPRRTPKITFEPKMPIIGFYSQSKNIGQTFIYTL